MNIDKLKVIFAEISDEIIENEEYLTDLDRPRLQYGQGL